MIHSMRVSLIGFKVFATRVFDKWCRKERIADRALWDAVNRADLGLIEANLKGSLIELRVARGGAGKSGGYRIILAYKVRDRAFFLYGFSKNDRAIIGEEEEEGYAEYGAILL